MLLGGNKAIVPDTWTIPGGGILQLCEWGLIAVLEDDGFNFGFV